MSHRRHVSSQQSVELPQLNTIDPDDIVAASGNSTNDDQNSSAEGSAVERDELLDDAEEYQKNEEARAARRETQRPKATWERIVAFFANEYNRRVMIQVSSCLVLVSNMWPCSFSSNQNSNFTHSWRPA